jgi:serine/threonine-protein kinase RsbW
MTETMQELRFPSVPENIAIVERLIDDLRNIGNFQEECYGDVLIAMTEAVNNAIVHGNKMDMTKQVLVEYEIQDKDLFFRVHDEGPGFDFENIPDPTSPENLEKPNGRGVFLMRSLADGCEFLEDGRIVELRFASVYS